MMKAYQMPVIRILSLKSEELLDGVKFSGEDEEPGAKIYTDDIDNSSWSESEVSGGNTGSIWDD